MTRYITAFLPTLFVITVIGMCISYDLKFLAGWYGHTHIYIRFTEQ